MVYEPLTISFENRPYDPHLDGISIHQKRNYLFVDGERTLDCLQENILRLIWLHWRGKSGEQGSIQRVMMGVQRATDPDFVDDAGEG